MVSATWKKYLREDQKKRNIFAHLREARKEDIQKIQIHERRNVTASPKLKYKTYSC